jgi:hypothetical protein
MLVYAYTKSTTRWCQSNALVAVETPVEREKPAEIWEMISYSLLPHVSSCLKTQVRLSMVEWIWVEKVKQYCFFAGANSIHWRQITGSNPDVWTKTKMFEMLSLKSHKNHLPRSRQLLEYKILSLQLWGKTKNGLDLVTQLIVTQESLYKGK